MTEYPSAFGEYVIDVHRYSLSEPEITIRQGTTVRWINRNSRRHLIVIQKPEYVKGTPMEGNGSSWNYTFDIPGEYQYVEAVFGLRGKVMVEEYT
ncbi:hypothetical protein GF351_04970 [Candidatus Woesearchaeota archaeon]|nr:hypothetical protein [Candidatus Woesearchaeota archaeon]